MNFSAIVKGISIGATVGTACFLVANTSERKRHSMKRHAGKALKAAGTLLEDITSAMM